MGSCFFVHGMRYMQGYFHLFRVDSITSLNAIAVCFLLIPSTLRMTLQAHNLIAFDNLMLITSHGIAIILLILYVLYLRITLITHNAAYDRFEEDEDDREPFAERAHLWVGPIAASIWLAISLAVITLCTVALISSLQVSTWKAKESFIGFVLFPFLGNVPDYSSALRVAYLDQLDITILATTGSSMQLLLFNLPVLVILGWIINEPMTLSLHLYESATVFLGVFVVRYVIVGGECNYLCGAICIAL